MNRRLRCILLAAGFVALFNQTVFADVFPNSLWLGNDSFIEGKATLYNVDRLGNVLQSFPELVNDWSGHRSDDQFDLPLGAI